MVSAKKEPFKPEEHFRNLKGQQYLEVKWRLVWFREEHPDGDVETALLHHDPDLGLAVFKATVSFPTNDGRSVSSTGHGSETRKDFNDYLEKSETKAIGRALAILGYGTQFAQELEEGDRIVDSPVDPRKPARNATPATPVAHDTPAPATPPPVEQTQEQRDAALKDRYITRIVQMEGAKIQRAKIATARKAWATAMAGGAEVNIANPSTWDLAQLESYGKFLSTMEADPEVAKDKAAKGAA